MAEISLQESNEGWKDVILPDGALKSGMLKGLIGFQELETEHQVPKKVTKKKQRKRNAAILFEGEDVPAEPKPAKKKKKQRPKKKKAKEVVEPEKVTVSNEDYQFQNKLTAWSRMNLVKPLLRILDEKALLQPTEVQLKTIPRGLNTKTNILAAAETGSGKTFAFGLPLVQKIHGHIEKYGENAEFEDGGFSEETEEPDDSIFGEKKTKQGPLGLILCPTRELAVQVHDQIRLLATHTKVRTAVIIGGMSDDKQERVLSKHKPHIVVATPGRFWELTRSGQDWLQSLDLVKYLVIDEADRMAEKGHFAELGSIVSAIGQCQKFIFSATLTLTHKGSRRMEIKKVKVDTAQDKMRKLMKIVAVEKEQAEIFDLSNKTMTASKLEEFKVVCTNDKEMFVNAISAALRLNGLLAPLGLPTHSLHSNMQQKARLKHMDRFKSDENAILVSTDVAARGLDIPNVELIIHFQFPKTAETYVHRSGRAARAGKSGQAVALLGQADNANYKKIMNSLHKPDLTIWDESQPSRTVYDRLSVATKIDKMSHDKKKETVEKNWFKENVIYFRH